MALPRGALVEVPGSVFVPGETKSFSALVLSTVRFNEGSRGRLVITDLILPLLTVVDQRLVTDSGDRMSEPELAAFLAPVDAALRADGATPVPSLVPQRHVAEAPIPFAERTGSKARRCVVTSAISYQMTYQHVLVAAAYSRMDGGEPYALPITPAMRPSEHGFTHEVMVHGASYSIAPSEFVRSTGTMQQALFGSLLQKTRGCVGL